MALTAFDADAVIALIETEDAFHAASVARYEQLRLVEERFILPASAYAEVLVGPWKHGEETVDRVMQALRALRFEVWPLDEDLARGAAGLRARFGSRLRLPDALVIATAIVGGAERVVTTDARWPVIDSLMVDVLRPG